MLPEGPLNVLILYDAYATFTQTVVEHLRSFAAFSRNRIWYAHAARVTDSLVDLSVFDAVVVHYSLRLVSDAGMSDQWASELRAFNGAKVLFVQDEYESTETTRRWMERLGFDVVFTCVPEPSVKDVYLPSRFSKTRFVTTLTGFVPPRFEDGAARKPIRERERVVAYRGRELPFWFGKLAREKFEIGVRMKQICAERGIPADIEWSESARVYGERWYEFLGSAKATLGTESGANVFDETGELRHTIDVELRKTPNLTFEEVWQRLLEPREGKVRMNQISPKLFEAIALGTALVLYEGEYSGIVRPWEHYIPLKKDYSNVEEVIAALRDDKRLQEIADRAWTDVIGSGRWSYRAAIGEYDRLIGEATATKGRVISREPFLFMAGTQGLGGADPRPVGLGSRRLRDLVTTAPLLADQALSDLGNVPHWLRVVRAAWRRSGLGVLVNRLRGV